MSCARILAPLALAGSLLTGACFEEIPRDSQPDAGPPPDARPPPDAAPPPACGDGLDNDGDGLVDFPFEPGCDDYSDEDEVDPVPLPQCSNGLDDDGDGYIDEADPGCSHASDPDEYHWRSVCGPAIVVEDISATGTASGTFTGGSNETQSDVCGGLGSERAYIFNIVGPPVTLVVSTDFPDTMVDTVVYVRTDCLNWQTELGCDDDSGAGNSSVLTRSGVTAGTYYIVVDTFGPGSLGDFDLQVTATPE